MQDMARRCRANHPRRARNFCCHQTGRGGRTSQSAGSRSSQTRSDDVCPGSKPLDPRQTGRRPPVVDARVLGLRRLSSRRRASRGARFPPTVLSVARGIVPASTFPFQLVTDHMHARQIRVLVNQSTSGPCAHVRLNQTRAWIALDPLMCFLFPSQRLTTAANHEIVSTENRCLCRHGDRCVL